MENKLRITEQNHKPQEFDYLSDAKSLLSDAKYVDLRQILSNRAEISKKRHKQKP